MGGGSRLLKIIAVVITAVINTNTLTLGGTLKKKSKQ